MNQECDKTNSDSCVTNESEILSKCKHFQLTDSTMALVFMNMWLCWIDLPVGEGFLWVGWRLYVSCVFFW